MVWFFFFQWGLRNYIFSSKNFYSSGSESVRLNFIAIVLIQWHRINLYNDNIDLFYFNIKWFIMTGL